MHGEQKRKRMKLPEIAKQSKIVLASPNLDSFDVGVVSSSYETLFFVINTLKFQYIK